MWNKYIIFVLIDFSKAYTNIPHKFSNNNNNNNNKLIEKRNNLQKNIEIYESIKKCNISDINSCAVECTVCEGKKLQICNYCRGTGFLTIGDELIGTRNNCTICMGKGEKECRRCMGSGYIAKWRR